MLQTENTMPAVQILLQKRKKVMKHLFLNLLFFTMLSFLVQSCKKDEPENENAVSNESTLKSMIAEDGANPDEADVKATEKESDDQRHRRSPQKCAPTQNHAGPLVALHMLLRFICGDGTVLA